MNMEGDFLPTNLSAYSSRDLNRTLYFLKNNGSWYEQEPDTTQRDALALAKWVTPPLLVFLGTVGNCLAAAVLLGRRFRSISTSIFLLALAASDTIYLYFSNFTLIWLSQYLLLSPRLYSDWSCQLIAYIFRSAADVSSWLVVAVTVERLLAVCLPFRAKALCSRPRAVIAVLLIVLAFLSLNTFTFFTYKVHDRYNNRPHRLCYVSEERGPLTTLAIVLYDDMSYSFLPACIICVSNTAILVRMVQQGRRTRRKGRKEKNGSCEARRLTAMLITVSCVFLVCTLPICTVSSYYAVMKYSKRTVDSTINRPLATLTLRILMNSNHAFNFLLYCLSGPPFRQELYRLTHDTACAIRQAVHPSPQTEHTVTRTHHDVEPNGDSIPMIEKTNEVTL